MYNTSLELHNPPHHPILFDRPSVDTDTLTDRQIDLLAPTVNSTIQSYRSTIDVFTIAQKYGDRFICLDSCAGESIFMNKNLFYRLDESDYPLIVSITCEESIRIVLP